MKNKLWTSAVIALILSNAAVPTIASATQTITEATPGGVGEVPFSVNVKEIIPPVEPEYIITIPSGLDANADFEEVEENGEKKLVDFKVTASQVSLPEHHAVQVDVKAKDDYQIDGKNVLLNENGDDIGYSFKRQEGAKYGLEEGFDEGDASGNWTIAQFRNEGDDLFAYEAPVSIVTHETEAPAGQYNSVLQFTVGVVDNTPIELERAPTDAQYFTTKDAGDGTVHIIGYDKVNGPTEVVIPVELDGKPVSAVMTADFRGDHITFLEVPGTFKNIEKGAFNDMRNLETLILNEGLETIGDQAFYNSPLKAIDLPKSVRSIGSEAFYGNVAEEIVIPDNVQTVAPKAFYQKSLYKENPPLKRIVIGENVTFLEPGGQGTGYYFGSNTTENYNQGPAVSELVIKQMDFNVEQLDHNLRKTYDLHVLAGSRTEMEAQKHFRPYEYIGLPSDYTERDQAFATMLQSSREFAKDGVIEVGEDAFNEHPLQYQKTSSGAYTSPNIHGKMSDSNKWPVLQKDTVSKTHAQTIWFNVKPGEVYRFDAGEKSLDGNKNQISIKTTNGEKNGYDYYQLIHLSNKERLIHNHLYYEIPEGATMITVDMYDSVAEFYGASEFDGYRLVRVK